VLYGQEIEDPQLMRIHLNIVSRCKRDYGFKRDDSDGWPSVRRALSFLGGFVVGALIFGIGGVFFGYLLAHFGEPSVIVRNLTHSPIPQVRIETDVGETYALESIPPGGSRRTQISGRDKALWVVATSLTGETKKSEQIYVSSQGTVFVAVSVDALTIDYEL
jgi:hypothetical protein